MPEELVRDEDSDFGVRRDVGKIDQRVEGGIQLVGLLHPLGVFEKMAPGVGQKALRSSDLPQLKIDGVMIGLIAKDFVTECYRVVVEAGGDMAVNGRIPEMDALIHVAYAPV